MCGIAGIVRRDGVDAQHVATVARINELLAHRGPDGSGHFENRYVALAMRRLSIIDLATGWQPLYNEDRSLALVANGEVYNFIELRRMLESRGHRFSTKSDCETILHLYEDHGDQCVEHLRGMYAFALWDSRKRRLLLVRDRMGEKPLYLVQTDGQIIFASELKSLIGSGAAALDLDPHAIHLYFHYSYVPEPMCIVRGVRKLPAGHMLSVDVDRWRVEQRCYWRMEDAPPIDDPNPAALIRQELDRVSELVIRSDVPVGVALSGGMDSSAIATLAAKHYPGTMQAFSVGYPGRPMQDERRDAKALADHLGMPFHDIELSTSQMVSDYPAMVAWRDDPIADIGGPNYYTVMKLARSHNVPVMMMGQGGDELFWGYRWVKESVSANERKQRLRGSGAGSQFPGSRRQITEYLKLTRPPYSYSGAVRWLGALGGLGDGWRQWHLDRTTPAQRMVFYDRETGYRSAARRLLELYTPTMQQRVLDCNPASIFTFELPWPQIDVAITKLITETYLLENGIVQGDRLSMASSVELRLPLVDYRLAEIVVGLRKRHSDSHLEPKKWLKDDIVPPFVMSRRKRGFTPPWRDWMRALSAAYGKELLDGYLVQHDVLSRSGAEQLRDQLSPHALGVSSSLSLAALALETWCRQMGTTQIQAAGPRPSAARTLADGRKPIAETHC
jgi:asparagine synthase (glutamine-hydrolysing)